MPDIHVYEPALCCNTGVCGPELDQQLVVFTADVEHCNEAGGSVTRHNLANDPQSFTTHDGVRRFLELAGSEGLPLTTVDGVTMLTGRYPSRAELLRWAEVSVADCRGEGKDLGLTAKPAADGGCCAPASGCC